MVNERKVNLDEAVKIVEGNIQRGATHEVTLKKKLLWFFPIGTRLRIGNENLIAVISGMCDTQGQDIQNEGTYRQRGTMHSLEIHHGGIVKEQYTSGFSGVGLRDCSEREQRYQLNITWCE